MERRLPEFQRIILSTSKYNEFFAARYKLSGVKNVFVNGSEYAKYGNKYGCPKFGIIKRKTPFVLTYEKKINQNVA
jgi:hypothetical protein